MPEPGQLVSARAEPPRPELASFLLGGTALCAVTGLPLVLQSLDDLNNAVIFKSVWLEEHTMNLANEAAFTTDPEALFIPAVSNARVTLEARTVQVVLNLITTLICQWIALARQSLPRVYNVCLAARPEAAHATSE
ncbi:hypothetical protein ACOZ38_04120 [Sphaerisporangium viridialbum]|uniref:hypothetical protein n=1 Tax=Sphaerisporangium viridialbum TaxID=46189 RepID=UPI003C748B35